MATDEMASASEKPEKRQSGGLQAGDDELLDYVTLAKAGGRKGLLQHCEYVRVREEAESYPVVEWFAHPTPPPPPPDAEPYQSPLHKSWMTWNIPDKKTRLPRLVANKPAAAAAKARRSHPPTKLPPLLDDKVEFGRLLSMDYQKEWLMEREAKQQHELQRAKEKRKARKHKLLEHTMKARRVAGLATEPSSKPRFIMKRFATVPAKLKLPSL